MALRPSAKEIHAVPDPPDEMVHALCPYTRSTDCLACPRERVVSGHGPGVPGCYALAREACKLILAMRLRSTPAMIEDHLLRAMTRGMLWTMPNAEPPREWHRCFWCGETMPDHQPGCQVHELIEARLRVGQPRIAADVARDIEATVGRLNDLLEEAYHGPGGTDVTVIRAEFSGEGILYKEGSPLRLHLRMVIE